MIKLSKSGRFYFTRNDDIMRWARVSDRAATEFLQFYIYYFDEHGRTHVTCYKSGRYLYVVPGWENVWVFSSRDAAINAKVPVSMICTYIYDISRSGWVLRGKEVIYHSESRFKPEKYCELFSDFRRGC